MSPSELINQSEIPVYIEKGYLHARVILEILGKPKEHIEKTLQTYIDNISKSDQIKLIYKEIAPAKERKEEKMWSTFAELEFLIKGVSKLVGFCFDYMPSSIEILAPKRIVFNQHTITDFINDLQAKLHKMDLVLKNYDTENKFLKNNMHLIVQNLIILSLVGKKLTQEELAKITGIPTAGLQNYLKFLKKENKIKKEQDKYFLA